jgi:hypothetical protein
MAFDYDKVLGACMNVFGQSTLYTAPGSPAFALTGVFDRCHVEVSFDSEGVAVSTQFPVLGVRAAAFPAGIVPSQGDRVGINGTDFQVTDTQPDGQGHVLLILKLAR